MSNDPYNLKKLSPQKLYEWTSGWKPNSEKYIAGQQEIHRRNEAPVNFRAWVAIGISVASLIVAFIALIKS